MGRRFEFAVVIETFKTRFNTVSVFVQSRYGSKNGYVETDSGTGYEPVPKRIIILAEKSFEHHNNAYPECGEFYRNGWDVSRGKWLSNFLVRISSQPPMQPIGDLMRPIVKICPLV